MSPAGIKCPACGDGVLARHCAAAHPTCTWGICRKCGSTIDWVTKRHSHPPTLRVPGKREGRCVACGPVTYREVDA